MTGATGHERGSASDDPFTGSVPDERGSQPPVRPGTSAPELVIELLDGSIYNLTETHPKRFTMVVFFRGYFCGVCRRYLPEIQSSAEAFEAHGVEIVLASSDNRDRSEKIRDEWGIQLPIGHSLDMDTAQAWDLFLTRGDPNRPEMPDVFSEPGLYLVAPDQTIFFAATCTAPVGRPAIGEMLGWLEFMRAKNAYPLRGDYAPARSTQ